MQLNYKVYLQDILNSIKEISEYLTDIENFDHYISDTKTMRAIENILKEK